MKRVSYSFVGQLLAPLALLALVACHPPTNADFYDRGSPHALLDVSSEVVNLSVAGKSELVELGNWIAGDQPTRAELFCDATVKTCKDAVRLLQTKGVETNVTTSPNNTVTLIYERILARDCSSRYIDKGLSLYNEAPPSYGCAIAANMVQQVSDKREFINPSLSDDPSASRAAQTYRRGMKPPQTTGAAYGAQSSMTGSAGGGQQ